MYKKVFFIVLSLAFILFSSANAKTIIWVAGTLSANTPTGQAATAADAAEDWQEWIDKLTAEGYTVDARPGYWDALTDALVAELNAADLVIFSRATDSGTYATNAAEIGLWNSVTTPMIVSSPYVIRTTNGTAARWNWINNNDASLPNNNGDQGCPLMQVTKASHPIFSGVSLSANNQLQVADPSIGSGHCSFDPTNNVGNGTLIAKTVPTSLVQDYLWIAEWQKDVEFYTGSGTYAGGHRMFFTAGAHETPIGGTFKESEYNFTEEGWKLYLNAVEYMLGELEVIKASSSNPIDKADDIDKNVILGWSPGMFANTHNVFFGTDFNDVNDATVDDTLGVTVKQNLAKDVNYFDPGTLELETTYYWRVDEVNAPPDSGINKGNVWSFTTEDIALKLPASDIKVTAKNNKSDPNNTINEVGLDLPNNPDQHSSSAGIWQSGTTNGPTDLLWIRYDFAKTYKLHEMLVWNMNSKPLLSLGFKQVRIEYLPPDSSEWTILTEMEFAKGAGTNGYVYNTTVPFNDTVAKAVRLTMINNWSGKDTSGALSEIRFKYIPTYARLPHPETGTTDVSVASPVSWRAGREAVSHNVYIDTNEDAVKNGTAAANSSNTNSYSPSLNFGRTYYWRVDEINNSMTPSVWKGDIWSFSTQEYKSIEDFEDYNDFPGSLIYDTWLDGLTNSALGGSVVGHEVAPFAEKTIVPQGSRQSLPLYYNNTAAGTNTSIAERTFDDILNLSANGADTLKLYYRGRAVTFQQASDGSIAMSAEGSDIQGTADQFRFAYKTMTGNGSITVRVDSIQNVNAWSKAGIMIRNSLDADDMHVTAVLGANGTAELESRSTKGGATTTSDVTGLGNPCWLKISRSGNTFTAQRSKDGTNWLSFGTDPSVASTVTIAMGNVVYIGLAVTSHTADTLAAATLSNVSTSNNVTGSTWTVAAIGDTSQAEGENTLDALYVYLTDSTGKASAKVFAPMLSAAGTGVWTEWQIPTSGFTGIDKTKVKRIAIGVGNPTAPLKGNGLVYIDDITLGHALEQ